MRKVQPRKGSPGDKAEQIAIDKIVDAALIRWEEDGRPTEWEAMHGKRIRVPASQIETVTWRAKRSGSFYKCKVRLSDIDADGDFASIVLTAWRAEDSEDDEGDEDSLESLAQEMYGKSYDELNDEELAAVEARDAELEGEESADQNEQDHQQDQPQEAWQG
jgi:hypothetical protein